MNKNTDDLRINKIIPVISPAELQGEFQITDTASNTVYNARKEAHRILHGDDDRLLVVVGPCSIHDTEAAMEYADKLLALREDLKDQLHIIMRVYFEKPRTSIGWKGLINDSDLLGKFDINKGLGVARKLLLDLSDKGMPAATEYLDLITPQYIADLVSWAAIGARTTESQGHRELSSGVSCPIGFKNGTNGNVDVAINAIKAASQPHHFLSVTKEGRSAIFETKGNEDCHVILRGGTDRANYDSVSIESAIDDLKEEGLPLHLMVDFSHANSGGDYNNQVKVGKHIATHISTGSHDVCGVMIESHLLAGRQNGEGKHKEDLVYGQSITDACIDWGTTDSVLRELAQAVEARRNHT
ncbi:MAG TPA: 3-deoxy-7-phosphoheptulonate synthase [Leucothrix mucor]|uniref:Phospho-2-dehydro-3-deoxyheptonate aldolase n=1 Tax=Leucothrix mucor TaxID=45248 RepID=A0A7V2T4Y1_LEUMU|nr:3-deoxy-7-phosphoheptulonate synthase [Leucothrix mucor]